MELQQAYVDAYTLRTNVFYLALTPTIIAILLVTSWASKPEKRQLLGYGLYAVAAAKAFAGIGLIFLIPQCPDECICADVTFSNMVYSGLCFAMAYLWVARADQLLSMPVVGVAVAQPAATTTAVAETTGKAMV